MAPSMLKKTRVAVILFYVSVFTGLALHDEKPGPELLQDSTQPLLEVTEPGNAWIAFLGFGSPEGVAPYVSGAEQMRKVQDAVLTGKNIKKTLQEVNESTFEFKAKIPYFYGDYRGMLAYAAANPDEATALMRDNEEWIRRYEGLGAYPRYIEPIDYSLFAPTPWFGSIKKAGQLKLLQLAMRAGNGDVEAALVGLREDTEFWRRIARSSTTIMSKMIAFVMLSADLPLAAELGASNIVREKELAIVQDTMRPFDKAEVGLAATLRGEARFIRKGLELSSKRNGNSWNLEALVCKPNALGNRIASDFADYIRLAGMNARELAIEVKKRSDNNEGLRRIGVPLLYNPLGEIAAAKIQAQFSVAAPVYIRTGYDLEGLRRLLLLKVLSYRESIPKEGMQDFLDAHKAQLGNPYTGASMIWDPKSGYIFFTNMDGMKVHAVSL